jgi:hypothetical protein
VNCRPLYCACSELSKLRSNSSAPNVLYFILCGFCPTLLVYVHLRLVFPLLFITNIYTTTCFGVTGHLQVYNLVCRSITATATVTCSILGSYCDAVNMFGFTCNCCTRVKCSSCLNLILSFWEVVGLERGPLSLVITIDELLERKSSGSCLESREYGCRDPSRWPRGTYYPQRLALTSPASDGRSVGIVRSLTRARELVFLDSI